MEADRHAGIALLGVVPMPAYNAHKIRLQTPICLPGPEPEFPVEHDNGFLKDIFSVLVIAAVAAHVRNGLFAERLIFKQTLQRSFPTAGILAR